MTLIDKIRGWADEESWVGSKFAACMWIYTQEALTAGQIRDREQEQYLKKLIMSIMLCTNGSVLVLSLIQLSSRRKNIFKHDTGFQNRSLVYCGSQRPRTWIESWEVI